MKTLDGTTIELGMEVYLLQVPVIGQHEFKIGTVHKITDKTVHVSYPKKDRWGTRENVIVKRYPDQLIAKKGE